MTLRTGVVTTHPTAIFETATLRQDFSLQPDNSNYTNALGIHPAYINASTNYNAHVNFTSIGQYNSGVNRAATGVIIKSDYRENQSETEVPYTVITYQGTVHATRQLPIQSVNVRPLFGGFFFASQHDTNPIRYIPTATELFPIWLPNTYQNNPNTDEPLTNNEQLSWSTQGSFLLHQDPLLDVFPYIFGFVHGRLNTLAGQTTPRWYGTLSVAAHRTTYPVFQGDG